MQVGQKPAFFIAFTDKARLFSNKNDTDLQQMKIRPVEHKVADLIADDLSAMGYELVRIQMTGGTKYATLQIMVDRKNGKNITVEDCAAVSRAVSDKLDAEDTLAASYTLEVSSPGIDRPLVRVKDFERFRGHTAKIELGAPLEAAGGKRRFEGHIVRITGDAPETATIEFRTDKGEFSVPMKEIVRAQLVLTEALLKTAAQSQSNQAF